MKKFLVIILTLAMIFSMGSFGSVIAESEPTVTIETIEAKAGEAVAVKVLIANNPGIWGMDLKISYDKTALTLESVENGDFFASSEWTKGNVENEVYTLSYAANAFEDIITSSGTLAILNFKVSDNAVPGDYNITASYNTGDIINIDFDEINFKVVDGKVSIKADEPEVNGTIIGATLDIGSSLTINYLAEAPENAKMKFTSSSGRVTEVNGVYDEKTGYYKFAYTGINPQCMGDTLKAELMVEETVLDTKENYSIQSYCENQIAKSASELGFSEHQFEAFKTLLADMLAYGSASQEYKNYNADALVDGSEWVSQYKTSFTAPEGVKTVTGNADADNKVKSVGLNMANVNRIYFKLILNDDVVIKLNGNVVDKENLIEKDGVFTLYTDAIFATQFGEVYTLELVKGEETITTVQYNVNAYIQAKHGAQGLEKIVKALSNYGTSAIKYQKSIIEGEFDLEGDIL